MTLQARLDRMREASAKKIPPAALSTMHRALDGLRASGIIDRVIKVGATLPAFALPDTQGQLLRSETLLAQGPLVLSFYRGLW